MKKILVIDTETTGLDPVKNSIWQIGMYYRDENGQLQAWNLKCKPLDAEFISEEALRVCKVTKEELMQLPDAKEMYLQFRNLLCSLTQNGEKLVWVGYNCRFDQGFVEAFIKHFDPKDTIWNFFDRHHVDMLEFMRILRATEFLKSQSLKLETTYKLFGLGTETAHDALADVHATYVAYQWMEEILRKGMDNNRYEIA